VLGLIYPEGITRTTQIVLAALLIVGNIVVYTLWARRRRRNFSQGSDA